MEICLPNNHTPQFIISGDETTSDIIYRVTTFFNYGNETKSISR